MRTHTALLALCTALAATTPASAACDVSVGSRCLVGGGPEGRMCAFNSVTDLTSEPGWQIGDVNAGPLYTGAPGTLHCKIVINASSHAAPATVDVPVRAVGGVVVMAQQLNYRATAADTVTLCTSWVPDAGEPLYWVGEPLVSLSARRGYWDTSPNSPCSVFYSDPNDLPCGIWLAVDQRAGTNIADIWQDCEPYEPII